MHYVRRCSSGRGGKRSGLPGSGRSRRDECFSASATRGRRLTQDQRQSRQSRQSDPWGNRYIQSWRTELGGWFSLPGTSAATPYLPIRLTSTEGAGRCRHGGLLVGIGRGDHEMRSPGRSISIAIGRSSNGRRPTHSFGLRTHGDGRDLPPED
jgi:hypothetical protein